MGATGPESAEIESIKNEIRIMREKNEGLEKDNEELKEKLRKYESGQ
jgi:regulator of replication initiation timing